MDPYTTFGAPLLGAVFNVLVSMASDAVKKLKSGRKEDPAPAPIDPVLRGRLVPLSLTDDTTNMAQVEQDLVDLSENYSGLEALSPDDPALLATLSRLRDNLEVVFGQRITFQGEEGRPDSGTQVAVDHKFRKIVNAKITGAKSRLPESRVIRLEADEVHGGEIIGFDGSET